MKIRRLIFEEWDREEKKEVMGMRKKAVISIVVFVMACVLFGAVVSGAADAERKGLGFATSEQNTYSEHHENENIY